MQKSLILLVFGSVIVVCVAGQLFSMQQPIHTAQNKYQQQLQRH